MRRKRCLPDCREGLLKTVTDARGASSDLKYNARGNLVSISYDASQGVVSTQAVNFGYDDEGRREWMQDGAGRRVEYRYDERGRLKEEKRRFNDLPDSAYTLSYEYGVASGLQKVSASWGETVGLQT